MRVAVTFHVTPVTLHGRRKQRAGVTRGAATAVAALSTAVGEGCRTVPKPLDSSFATVAEPFLEGLGKGFLEALQQGASQPGP